MRPLGRWLEAVGAPELKGVVAPMVVVGASTPVIVLGPLLLVAGFMTRMPASRVAQRRFPDLERKAGASMVASVGWSLAWTALTLL